MNCVWDVTKYVREGSMLIHLPTGRREVMQMQLYIFFNLYILGKLNFTWISKVSFILWLLLKWNKTSLKSFRLRKLLDQSTFAYWALRDLIFHYYSLHLSHRYEWKYEKKSQRYWMETIIFRDPGFVDSPCINIYLSTLHWTPTTTDTNKCSLLSWNF